MTQMVLTLEEFMEAVRPAYGGETWAEAVKYLQGEPYESKIVEALRSELKEGAFRNPVRIEVDDEDGTLRVGNGMHRTAALILEGEEHVVVDTEAPEGTYDHGVDVTYTTSHPGLDWEDEWDLIMGTLRSFREGDTWFECETFASHDKQMSGLWYCTPDQVPTLLRALKERYEAVGGTLEVLTYEEWHGWDEDVPEE